MKPNVAPEDRMNLAVADFFTRAARLLPALQQRLESEEPLHGPNWREVCLPFVKALEELEVHRYDDTKWIYVELDGRNRGIFAGLGKDLVNVYRSVWPKG